MWSTSATGPALAEFDLTRLTQAILEGDLHISAAELIVRALASGTLRVAANGVTGSFTAEGLAVCGTIADEAAFAATLLEVMRNTATRLALGGRVREYAKRNCDVAAYRQSLIAALARQS